MKRSSALVIGTFAALFMAGAALAQSTVTTEVKSGQVIGKTDSSIIVQMSDGAVREFQVPPGRTAMVDGKEVGLADLKLGTTLTATFTSTAKPVDVKTTTIKDAEVFKVSGSTLVTKEKDGLHTYQVPTGFRFHVNGKETTLANLTPSMKLSATIVHTSHKTEVVTTRKVEGSGPAEAPAPVAAPAPPPPPAPAAPAPAAPAPAPELPKTGGPLPLLALLGAASLALGSGIRVYRSR